MANKAINLEEGEIRPGDWVRVLRDRPRMSSKFWRDWKANGEFNSMKAGEVFRIIDSGDPGHLVYESGMGVRTSLLNQGLVKVESPYKGVIATLTSITALTLSSILLSRSPSENTMNELTNFLSQPAVNYSLQGLVIASSVSLGYSLLLRGVVRNTGNALGAVGDRWRRIRKEKDSGLAKQIAEAIKATQTPTVAKQ